ncbi:MAG: hypothetical protein AABZ15_00540 [Nitrospirota bacterium]
MPDQTDVLPFKGSTLRVSVNTFLYLLLFGLLVSYGLMGANWASFFALSLAAVLPVAVVITLVTAWGNRFSFDDEQGAIVKPGRRPIPFGRITGIFINERLRSLDVFMEQGWRGTTFLIEALDASERRRLEKALATRLPGLQVRNKRWTTAVAVAVMLALLLAGFGAAHGFLYKRFPQLAKTPQAVTWDAEKSKKRPQLEYLEDFEFTLPAGVKLITDMGSQIFFEDKVKKLKVKVAANIQRPDLASFETLLRRGMGVRDYYELLDLSYRTRIGIIPVFLRSLELQGLENITVYRVGPPLLRGYITQGTREGEEETHIVLVGERPHEEIHFFITGPKRAPEGFIKTLVLSTRVVQHPGI